MARKLTAVTICVVVFLVGLMLNDYVHHKTDKNTKAVQVQMVQTVCDIANHEISGESEEACGDVQSQTNTEYICNYSGTSCWVESL